MSRESYGTAEQRSGRTRSLIRPKRSGNSQLVISRAFEPFVASESVRSVIRRIIVGASRARWVVVSGLVCCVLLASARAEAARVILAQFDGPKSDRLRWRVAAAFKRAGHEIVRRRSPSWSSPTSRFRTMAQRYDVDAFVAAAIDDGGGDSWTMTLSVRGADGEELGESITLRGSSLSRLVSDVKANAAERFDQVIGGGGGGAETSRVATLRTNDDAERELDMDAPVAASRKRKGSRQVVDLDAEAEAAAPPKKSSSGKRRRSQPADEEPVTVWNADGDSEDDGGDASESDAEETTASFEAEESAGELSSEPVDDGEGDPAGASSTLPFVRLSLRAGFVQRSLEYEQDLYDRLRTQETSAGTYRLEASLFVFARSVREYFALIGSYEGALTGSVQDADTNTTFGVRFSELAGGLRARYPFKENEVGLALTYGRLVSGLDDDGEAGVPEFAYGFVRIAADGTLRFGKLGVTGTLGARLPTGYGELAEREWFPRVSGYGMEAGLGVEYRLSKTIGLEAGGSLRRFVLNMNSRPADATGGVSEVAGGAVDAYLSGYVGVSFSL